MNKKDDKYKMMIQFNGKKLKIITDHKALPIHIVEDMLMEFAEGIILCQMDEYRESDLFKYRWRATYWMVVSICFGITLLIFLIMRGR